MAGGVDGRPGGILSVCRELTLYGEAIEYDLLTVGLHLTDLGTPALTWRDLIVFLRQAPRTSAYTRAREPERASWGVTDYLLATIADALAVANWQRASQGRRAPGPRPKPIPRPGAEEKQVFGRGAIRISDFNEWWDAD